MGLYQRDYPFSAQLEKPRIPQHTLLAMPEAFSLGFVTLYAAARLGSAISPAAGEVRKNVSAVVASAERSRVLFGEKEDAISEIWDVVNEHSAEDWNGDGAVPVDPIAASIATEFLRALPPSLPVPEISPEPDGALSLDWVESRSRMFSLSVGTTRRLPYAWIDGTDRGHAVAAFDGEQIPARVLEEIRRIRVNAGLALPAA